MSRVRVGKHRSVFPRGYTSRLLALLFVPAIRSRKIRATFYALPRSRMRTWVVARYFHRQMQLLERHDDSFFRAISPDAELAWFFEIYVGPDGWRKALTDWLDTLNTSVEMVEFINPPGPNVLLTCHIGGRGPSSGLAVETLGFFVITVEDGMAVRGRITQEKAEALEAVGLRE